LWGESQAEQGLSDVPDVGLTTFDLGLAYWISRTADMLERSRGKPLYNVIFEFQRFG